MAMHPETQVCFYIPGATGVLEPAVDLESCTNDGCDTRDWKIRIGEELKPLEPPNYLIPFETAQTLEDNFQGALVFTSAFQCPDLPFTFEDRSSCRHRAGSGTSDPGCFAVMNVPLSITDRGRLINPELGENAVLYHCSRKAPSFRSGI